MLTHHGDVFTLLESHERCVEDLFKFWKDLELQGFVLNGPLKEAKQTTPTKCPTMEQIYVCDMMYVCVVHQC